MINSVIYYTLVAVLQIFLQINGINTEELKCLDKDARKAICGENEYCKNGICECLPGYKRKRLNTCVKNSPINPIPSPAPYGPMSDVDVPPDGNNSHLAASIIIPIMLILVVIGSVVLVRKYNIITWVRNKINERQTPYDEVMIGQDDDDPPLSGV